MKIKKVLTAVVSVGIALTLAACGEDTEDQENMEETPPAETETTPSNGETDPGAEDPELGTRGQVPCPFV